MYVNGLTSGDSVAFSGTLTDRSIFDIFSRNGALFGKGNVYNVAIYAGASFSLTAVIAHRNTIKAEIGIT
jgi:hypothetical protein